MSRTVRRRVVGAAIAAAATATALTTAAATTASATPAAAAGAAAPDRAATRVIAPQDDAVAVHSLQSRYGLTAAQAKARIAAQHRLDTLADRIGRSLGDREVGSYVDQRTGRLVVSVSDPAAAAAVRAAGARARVVPHSAAELRRVKAGLDAAARAHRAGHALWWYVDPRTDRVVVTVQSRSHDAATAAFLRKARAAGDAVRIRTTTGTLGTQALYGGEEVDMSNGYICSLGFNAYDSSGQSVFLTAGHCGAGYPSFSRNGVGLGGTRGYVFPGNDFAFVNDDNPSYWAPQPAVDEYNGYAVYVYGYSSAPVGTSVCKSGRTTGWTCGQIQAYNVTVNYPEGTVYGLVQANACTMGGDSGGAWMAGNYAQGLTSGGQSYNGYCGQYYGYPNVTFYQPVGQALSYYGLRLQTP